MKARLVARGIPEHKILVAENWADGCEIVPAPFGEGPLVVHYSGTFGLAHEEYTITEAMRQLRGDGRFRFVFAGGGARRQRLEEFCQAEGIDTAEFRPYARRSDSPELAEGHVGLVTQIPETWGRLCQQELRNHGCRAPGSVHRSPGRNPHTHPEEHECGWRVEPGNAAGLVRLLERLEQDRGLVRQAGARARHAFEKYYDKPIGVAKILSILGVSETTRPIPAAAIAASTV